MRVTTPGGRLVQAVFAAIAVCAAVLACGGAMASAPAGQAVNRCGWFDNPTPGNAWLYDRDGEWTIGIQGGHQAKGAWPQFRKAEWVRTGHGSAGHGCVCLKLVADAESRNVVNIVSARAKPLSACRSDAAIKGKEPENPLK